MSYFDKKYAAFYDLLYSDKDYKAESNYILGLANDFVNKPLNTILDIGCGTGNHALSLSKQCDYFFGIDRSAEMIDLANKKNIHNAKFEIADALTFELPLKFDLAISMFHVASYITNANEFKQYFVNVRKHLNIGGLFIFDFWHGPGVLSDKPSIRVKRIENEAYKFIRISEPTMYYAQNIVDVKFTLIGHTKQTNKYDEFIENHEMRYWFLPEIKQIAENTGFEFINAFKWMERSELCGNDWYGVVVLRMFD